MQVLSEYIVQNPGLFPHSVKDVVASTREIRDTVFSTFGVGARALLFGFGGGWQAHVA